MKYKELTKVNQVWVDTALGNRVRLRIVYENADCVIFSKYVKDAHFGEYRELPKSKITVRKAQLGKNPSALYSHCYKATGSCAFTDEVIKYEEYKYDPTDTL